MVAPLEVNSKDVAPAVIELPGCDPKALADGVREVRGWLPGQWQDYRARASDWRAEHAHSVVAHRLSGMIRALLHSSAKSASDDLSG